MSNQTAAGTASPDSGSVERVAFDLMKTVHYHENKSELTREEILDLYVECRKAVRGSRP